MPQDLRYAFRMLLKSPGFTLVAVMTVALGIGANVAIFTVVDAVLLRPLPFGEPDRIVTITSVNPEHARTFTISTHDVEDWQKTSRTIERFAVWRDWGFTVRGSSETRGIGGAIASPEFFQVLDVKPAAGRLFNAEDAQPGHNRVVVLSYAGWQKLFGGDPGAIGRTLRLEREDEADYTVIGVLPPNFQQSPSFDFWDIWAPHTIDPDLNKGRYLRNRQVIARMRPGVSLQQVRAEMDTLAAQSAKQYPDTNAGWGVRVERMLDREVGNWRDPLLVFLVAVGLVLLIACVNVANLLLTRVTARRSELAVRLALGATTVRLGRLLLTESILICLLGGAAGLLMGSWTLDTLLALAPRGIPRIEQVHLDAHAFAFAAAVSLLTAVILGIVPARRASKVNVQEGIKGGGTTRTGSSHLRTGQILAGIEIALAMVLLIGAALLAKSFVRMLAIPADFNPKNLVVLQDFPSMKRYPEASQIVNYYRRVTEEVKAIPGVLSVANISALPYFDESEADEFVAEGQPESATGKYPEATYHNVSANYFATMEIPLVRGRDFNDSDSRGAPRVAIINQTFARRYWPDQDPIDKRVRLVREKVEVQVVGVVGDARSFPAGMDPQPHIYYPYAQAARWATFFVVRTSGDPGALLETVKSRIWSVDPSASIGRSRTMQEQMSRPLRDPKFYMSLMGIFAGLALMLAVIGVYGVLSYATAQRTHEIGVRLALGAQRGDILRLVLLRGMLLAVVGATLGAVGALGLTRFLAGMLFGMKANDPLIFAAVAIGLMGVALVATYIPARRAAKVDPLVALRYE